MSLQATTTRNTITLKGSSKIVTEFFAYAVNSILYQRGVYPPESFHQKKQYGLSLTVTSDDKLASYLATVLEHLERWLAAGALQRLVLVIAGSPEGDVLERWTFDVQTDARVVAGEGPAPDKDEAEIVAEIQAIMRQITACVSFLPLLSRPVSFDLLVYADKDKTSEVPLEWEDSDARMIEEGSANNVRLRSFTTKVHRVDAMVSYKMEPDDIC